MHRVVHGFYVIEHAVALVGHRLQVLVGGEAGGFDGGVDALLPQGCQHIRRQLSLQQSAVQGVFRLGSRKTDIQIQFALTPVPDGHIDRAGAVTVGQLLPLAVFEQIKGCDL